MPSLRTTRWHGTTSGTGFVGARRADGPHGVRRAGGAGDGGVALRRPERDLAQVREHVAAEAVGEPQVDRHVERAAASGEVLVELAGGGVEPRRVAQDARADVGGERGEHVVVVLARERDPHERRSSVAASSSAPSGLSTVR